MGLWQRMMGQRAQVPQDAPSGSDRVQVGGRLVLRRSSADSSYDLTAEDKVVSLKRRRGMLQSGNVGLRTGYGTRRNSARSGSEASLPTIFETSDDEAYFAQVERCFHFYTRLLYIEDQIDTSIEEVYERARRSQMPFDDLHTFVRVLLLEEKLLSIY